MSERTLKWKALDLLRKYEEAQETVIWEYSGTIDADIKKLKAEVSSIRQEIEAETAQSAQPQYEELTPEEAAAEIASRSIMSAWYWRDAMMRLKQMGYVICRKR